MELEFKIKTYMQVICLSIVYLHFNVLFEDDLIQRN